MILDIGNPAWRVRVDVCRLDGQHTEVQHMD